MRIPLVATLAAGGILWAAGGAAVGKPLYVETFEGPVVGNVERGVEYFLGIPYAEPPVGQRRLRSPVPHQRWTIPLSTAQTGSACPQNPSPDPAGLPSETEDCLFLNLFIPERRTTKPPVLVWIHGGAFAEGYGGSRLYDGSELARDRHVIVVTINYRLGALGFLSTRELDLENAAGNSGNFGLQDQQEALRWVQRNIRAFGGDPTNVTVFGESAGAMSVVDHLVSPAARGLFQRAIIQSAALNVHAPAKKKVQDTLGLGFLKETGCDRKADAAACLRQLPVSAFLKSQSFWLPIQDGSLIPTQPLEALRQGAFNRVPIIVGATEKEAYLFVARIEGTAGRAVHESDVLPLLSASVGDKAQQVMKNYPINTFSNPADAAATALGDGMFNCVATELAQAMATFAPVYSFEFAERDPTQQQPLPPSTSLSPGYSYHTTDLAYVFDRNLQGERLDGKDAGLSALVGEYWSAFARSGNPNHPGGPPWPTYKLTSRQTLRLTRVPTIISDNAESHHCHSWRLAGLLDADVQLGLPGSLPVNNDARH